MKNFGVRLLRHRERGRRLVDVELVVVVGHRGARAAAARAAAARAAAARAARAAALPRARAAAAAADERALVREGHAEVVPR